MGVIKRFTEWFLVGSHEQEENETPEDKTSKRPPEVLVEGAYYIGILYEGCLDSILRGEVIELPPWIMSTADSKYDIVCMAIGLKEKVEERVAIEITENEGEYFTYQPEHRRGLILYSVDEESIEHLRKGNILLNKYWFGAVAIMTYETFLKTIGRVRVLSDGFGMIKFAKFKFNIWFTLPIGGLNRWKVALIAHKEEKKE